jgi:hypothetical protein
MATALTPSHTHAIPAPWGAQLTEKHHAHTTPRAETSTISKFSLPD